MKKFSLIIIIIILIFPLGVNASSDTITVTLNKCVDGDTAWFNYNKDTIKVRFLAINTMELKSKDKNATLAKEYTCNMLSNAKNIKLEFDPKSDKKDKYDRYLAWIFVDDQLLQYDLVEKGYAEIKYIYGDYKYVEELEKKQDIAKSNKVGIWHKEETNLKDYSEYIYLIIAIICVLLGISTTKIKKVKKIIKSLK